MSAMLPDILDIDYSFTFQLDFCSRRVKMTGKHDGYPSYTARVKTQIYDWQQERWGLLDLLGDGEIDVDVEFSF